MEQRSGRAPGRLLSVRRALWSLAAGVVAGTATALVGASELTPLVVWTIAAGTILVWVWRACWSASPKRTEQLAEAEQHSRSTDSAILIASVASLAAVAEALVRASNQHDAVAVTLVILSVIAVVLAWALVNTVFALKYARLCYRDDGGGIDFKREDPPAYADFAYIAFTVGMSYAPGENERRVTTCAGSRSGTHCSRTPSEPASWPSPLTWSPTLVSHDPRALEAGLSRYRS
ncbi:MULTISPECIES: DUF1345 domain-containing protein [Micromonospora]|uniref:DUF1345 domain-containing protein n=1 Tax=Micromonospora TaxID=1873 RepID=UPI0018E9AE2E|nr:MULTISPECIES: DUF1345 domain-containing protein [Micromonospora]MBP1781951.1 putative membrane protein [Micromonospora sp. HB375]